jgi:lipopolysaccharide assembly protein A
LYDRTAESILFRRPELRAAVMIRFTQGVILLVFLGAILVFAWQNNQTVTISFLKWGLTAPNALVIVAVYLLGTLTGWTVVSYLRRSIQKVTQRSE